MGFKLECGGWGSSSSLPADVEIPKAFENQFTNAFIFLVFSDLLKSNENRQIINFCSPKLLLQPWTLIRISADGLFAIQGARKEAYQLTNKSKPKTVMTKSIIFRDQLFILFLTLFLNFGTLFDSHYTFCTLYMSLVWLNSMSGKNFECLEVNKVLFSLKI